MTAPAVRPARLADAGRIGAIHVQAWRETYQDLLAPARLARLDAAERAAIWRRQLASGTARGVAVAEEGGVVIGFASCTRQRTPDLHASGYTGEVAALYVLRAAQRHGAGRSLMRAMARRLIAEGERRMALWVLTANAGAREFYGRLGGTVVAERVDDGDEEVAYGWRDLAGLAAG